MTPAHFAGLTRRGRGSAAIAGAAALLLVGGSTGVLNTADAATPSTGTVTTSSPAQWGGGPFLVSNPSGTATGTPDCSAGQQACDDYTLNVQAPADYHVKVDVSWTNTASDFDVYLINSAGQTVGTAATSDDPEVINVPAQAGVYTVRVVPFLVTGDSYTASASLVPATATGGGNPGPSSTETAPGYQTYAAPASIPFKKANDAGEPSIGNNHNTGATMYQAGLSTLKVDFDGSTPAKATWSDVTAQLANGCPQGNTTSLDPILFTDPATGRTFESQLTGQDSLTCYTDDDGKTWSVSQGGGIISGKDHQTIGGGSYSAGAIGPLPGSTYPHAVYYCSQDIADALCAASNDGGRTFGTVAPTYTIAQCGGLHGHIRVAPDGTAYLPNKSCVDPVDGVRRAAVAVSTDGGVSWNVKIIDGSTAGESDPSVSIGAKGTVYVGYVGTDGLPAVATSTDRGETWVNGQSVGTKFAIKNAVFPTVIAGDDDRAAFAYLGTPTGGDSSATGVFQGIWHLYIDTTYDGGRTWVTSDATPTDPVQRGSICTNGTTCGNDRNLLDFIDVTMDKQGRPLVGFADGCIGVCVTDPGVNNRDAYSTIARQSTGKTLLAAFDPTATPTRHKAPGHTK